MDSGCYIIMAVNTTWCISAARYVEIQTFSTSSLTQKWSICDDSETGYSIYSSWRGRIFNAPLVPDPGDKISYLSMTTAKAHWHWDIIPTGNTANYDGESYETYHIKLTYDTKNEVSPEEDLYVAMPGASSAGANPTLETTASEFIFIPTPPFSDVGTYKIVSALDEDLVLGVDSESRASRANISALTDKDLSSQKFFTTRHTEDSTIIFKATHTQMGMIISNGNPGVNVMQYRVTTSNALDRWFVEQNGTMTVDGQIVPTYKIQNASSIGEGSATPLVINCNPNKNYNVSVENYNGSDKQRWAIIPTVSTDANCPIPSDIQANIEGLTSDYVVCKAGNILEEIPLSFDCDWSAFQARVRYRIKPGSNNAQQAYSNWSSWCSIVDGDSGNEGWGNPWESSFRTAIDAGDHKTTTADGNDIVLPIPEQYRVDGQNVQAAEIQLQLRAWDDDAFDSGIEGLYQVGKFARKTFRIIWEPTPVIQSAVLSGKGLTINYTSDLNAGGMNVRARVYEKTTTPRRSTSVYSVSGKYAGSGSITIPPKQFSFIPNGTIYVQLKIDNDAETMSNWVFSNVTVTDADNRYNAGITYEESYYGTHFIMFDLSDLDKDKTYMYVENNLHETVDTVQQPVIIYAIGVVRSGGLRVYSKPNDNSPTEEILSAGTEVNCFGSNNASGTEWWKIDNFGNRWVKKENLIGPTSVTRRVYEAITPLNAEFNALAWVQRNDGQWDAKELNIHPNNSRSFTWIFDGGACVLDYGLDKNPTQEDSISRASDSYEIMGREYHSYRLHKTKERDLSVTGVVVTDYPEHGTWEAFKSLLDAGHAIFRNQRGDVIPVVITNISGQLDHRYLTEISVTQYEETK